MYTLVRLISLLISISQETVLGWFGIKTAQYTDIIAGFDNYGLESVEEFISVSTDISLETFRLIVVGLWGKVLNGLTFTNIEDIILFLAFIRFIILAVKYNIKTSFYITFIGLAAAYLWYRHLIDLTIAYRRAFSLSRFTRTLARQSADLNLIDKGFSSRVGFVKQFRNPIATFFNAIVKFSALGPYRIDIISMMFANVKGPLKEYTDGLYYFIYRDLVPWVYRFIVNEGKQMLGLVTYTFFTRINKKYCPYLVRWHWTFLICLAFGEGFLFDLGRRLTFYYDLVLIPKLKAVGIMELPERGLEYQCWLVKLTLVTIMYFHLGLVIFGLLHALFGQYFFFPAVTEAAETHIGPRPKSSVYSGGYTAWQDFEEKKNRSPLFPKLWYGWFGRETKKNIIYQIPVISIVRKFLIRIGKKLRKKLRKLIITISELF